MASSLSSTPSAPTPPLPLLTSRQKPYCLNPSPPKDKEREAKERKEAVNRKIASQKAISIILRREATKELIENKRKSGGSSKKLLPRTLLEALHERITALRWESALKVRLLQGFSLIISRGVVVNLSSCTGRLNMNWLALRFARCWMARCASCLVDECFF